MTARQTICLVDGSGYIFRAFYALPQMTRADGTPVNAVYGFMNMMMNLSGDNPCSHIVVIFDAKRQNFRNDIYPAYKQNRAETPAELVPQFALIRQAVEVLNLPWAELAGFEADDLIATYTRIAKEKNWDVRIISADKDLTQLKQTGVCVYDPMKKREITDEDILKKFGVTPDKIVDVQSLMGDSIDNVPGAAGIGPKTAAELINTYGNLDNLLAHLDDIPQQKRREGLKRDKDQVLISRQLVRLRDDAPVSDDLEQFKIREPDIQQIIPFLQENGFKSLLSRVQDWTVQRTKTVDSCIDKTITKHYDLIQDEASLKQWLSQITDSVAIDTETTGLNPMTARLVGLSLGLPNGLACYVPLRHKTPSDDLFSSDSAPKQIPVSQALALLKPIFENPNIIKIGHNIKYDMHIFMNEDNSVSMSPIADTMVMSSVLNGSNHGHGLDELADIYLHHTTIKYTDVCGTGSKKIPFSAVPLDTACTYAAEDADITYRLWQCFSKRLETEDSNHIYHDFDLPLIPILLKMERAGILVDKAHLSALGRDFDEQLHSLTQQIHTLAGTEFNINSPAQLGEILFEKLGLESGKKGANGAYTTDVKVLETLADSGSEIAKKVLDYRGLAKLKSTYIDALLDLSKQDKRIHTSFSLTSTNTGRLASSDPNLQNIPIRTENGKQIRRSFIAKSGYHLLAADYSQIELRLMAEVAGVPALKASFINNEDIHARTASQIFNIPLAEITPDIRRQAKAINFGIIYGISAFGLANNLGIDRHQAQAYIDSYFAQYPEIRQYMRDTEQFALDKGYVLTPFGRKCFIHGLDNGKTRSFGLRAAINAPIQGGAADIIKHAMQHIHEKLSHSTLDCTMLLQVHDELVFEVADNDLSAATELIKHEMENVVSLSVPLIAEVGTGTNWKDAH